MATSPDGLLRAITIEELRQLRDKWGLPETKECPGTVQTFDGSVACPATLEIGELECPVCGHSFEQRH